MWQETTRQERNRRIFEEELEDFLPAAILDFHVHVFNPGVVPMGTMFSSAGHPISAYTIEDLSQDLADTFPGRKTAAVCFGFPHRDYDLPANNRYLARQCDGKRWFALRLFDPTETDPAKLKQELIEGRFRGLKPYPDYVRAGDPKTIEICQMLPAWAMEIVNELGLLIMLHIPRPGRLTDPLNQKQIRQLCERYPNARIVLAHIGRAYYLKCAVGYLEPLKDLSNLYFDLAMVNHWEVMRHLFQTVKPSQILYGSDIPIALAPGKAVEINDQYTYVTPVPWALSICDQKRKLVFTSFLYEELRAIKKATQSLDLGRPFVEDLFWNNGRRLLDSTQ